MNDPYSVLGIQSNASDDEVRKAYRELARKYHPDNYQDNPLADLAEEKMKEINEAYETITKQRAGGSSYGGGGAAYQQQRSSGPCGTFAHAGAQPGCRVVFSLGKHRLSERLAGRGPGQLSAGGSHGSGQSGVPAGHELHADGRSGVPAHGLWRVQRLRLLPYPAVHELHVPRLRVLELRSCIHNR